MLLQVLLFFNLLLLCSMKKSSRRQKESNSDELGGNLISSLRNDANLDLPMDEEYEDLRAELLAYHTALASIAGRAEDPNEAQDPGAEGANEAAAAAEAAAADPPVVPNTRRSMKTTPCWQLGGICVNYNMCRGHRFMTEVPGCKNKLEVCCFTWNRYETKDLRDKGLSNAALLWGNQQEYGGKGLRASNDRISSESDSDNGQRKIVEIAYNPSDLSSAEVQKKKLKKHHKMHHKKLYNKHHKKSKSKAAPEPIVLIVKPDSD